MKRLLKPLRYKRTDKLRDVIREYEGGIHKRIDENRELLETLQDSIPEFMAANPWIEDWLEAQDSFLGRIADTARLPAEEKLERNPRPWPGHRRGRRSRYSGSDITK